MTVLEATAVTRVERVDRITAQARQWPFGRTVLSLLAWLLVGVGRITYAVFAAVWLAVTWSAAAVKVGWDDARAVRAAQASRPGDETGA